MKYKYASIDIETLGLDPNTCDVIEIGVVLEDLVSPVESLPSLSFYVTYPGDNYKGNAYAMAMNVGILNAIGNRHSNEGCDKTFIPVDCVDEYMFGFFNRHGLFNKTQTQKILAAGKNFSGFDLPFLKSIGVGNKGSKTRFHHRTVDPGSLFFNPKVDDVPPSLDVCLERSGIDKSVDHLALNDAIDVIRVLRYQYEYV